jgi:hypothetical protein
MNWVNSWLSIVLGVLSICTFVGGTIAWYAGSVRKGYAAQRDFEHLKNNYKQMSQVIADIDKELDSRFDRLDLQGAKHETLLQSILARLNV